MKWKRQEKMTFENILTYYMFKNLNQSEWGAGSETKELTAFQMNTYPHLKKKAQRTAVTYEQRT